MKKILSLLSVLVFAYSVSAQVAFLQRVDNAETGYPAENYNNVAQQPEKNAYNWFNGTYSASDKHVLTRQQVKDGNLLTAGAPAFKVLWVNVDAVGLADLAAAGIDNDVINAIKAYVKAGGNLLLTKQASTLAYSIGRINYAPQWASGDYTNRGQMQINPHLGIAVSEQDRSSHAVFKDLPSVNINTNNHTYSVYPLSEGITTDNNNNFEPMKRKDGSAQGNDENNKLTNFENEWNCQVLATWGQVLNFCVPGLMEFFPEGDFKGTIIVNGFAAYQWGTSNTQKSNVEKLTANILDYLSKRATATWTTAPKANPVIKDEEYVTVTPGTNCTVTVTTSDPNIANYNEGHIYYNFFGDVTFTATATGDGVNIPKNAVLCPEVRIVTGGESDAEYGYMLPYSIKSLKEYTGADATLGYPDYLAAKWFYDHYIDPNRTLENNYGNGRFVAKENIPADDSIMKVLWFNMDRAGYAENDFATEFINTDFKTNLTTYATNGGNIFLTKQTCRLSKDMGRAYWYPVRFANGGISSNSDNWYITANFRLSEQDVDISKHAAFKYMGDPTTEAGGYGWKMLSTGADQRTDNNTVWEDWSVYGTSAGTTDMERLTVFEEGMHNCHILAGFGHTRALDAVGMIELLPYGSFNGTIIALGLSAYQWTTTNTSISNVQNLTKGVLEYLHDVDIYTRPVTANLYGTICLPRKMETISDGMTLYRVLSDVGDGIMLEEILPDETNAGEPYFFYSTASEIRVTMTGSAVLSPIGGNGLIGNFGPASITVTKNDDNYILAAPGGTTGLYFVDSDDVTIGANRAYLKRSAINTNDIGSAPGRTVRKMSIRSTPNTATGLEAPEEDNNIKPIKKLVNGHLYIQYGDKVYDITGNQIQ